MDNIKHVGRMVKNGRKVLVAYRTLPGDAFNCLVIPTESLQDSYHDALVSLVESQAAQQCTEFAEILNRSTFPDGSNMLISLHLKGFLQKVSTTEVEMIPNHLTTIMLDKLNHQIAQIKGVSVQDLAIQPDTPSADVKELAQIHNMDTRKKPEVVEEPLSDDALARKYRADAARLLEEVQHLTQLAEQLVPSPTVVAEAVEEDVDNTDQQETGKDTPPEPVAEKPVNSRKKTTAKA